MFFCNLFQLISISSALSKAVLAVAGAFLLVLIVCKSGLYHYSALKTLLFKLAAHLVGSEYIALILVIVCVAAAAAIELRPAAFAVGL